MAATAITPVLLVANTPGASLPDASGTVISGTGATEGWLITPARGGAGLFLRFVDDGSGSNLVVVAGARPPSHRVGLGNLAIALTASQVLPVFLEPSRFLNAAGKIAIYGDDAGTKIIAYQLPKVV